MKLEALIKIASRAYPEDLIFQAFKTKKPVGDGLAEFLSRELQDTFDPDQTSLEQLQEAESVIGRAARELNDVSDALSKANIKTYEDQWETRMIPLSFLSVGLKEPAPAKPKTDLNISLEDRVNILEKIAAGINSGLNDREIAEVSLKGISKAHLVACLRNSGSSIMH